MMKKILYAVAIALTLYLLLPFFYLMAPRVIKGFVYRELCYHTIADAVYGMSRDEEDFVKNINGYIYQTIDSHLDNMPIIDDTSWNCLERGFGYCDQQAWAMSTLLAKKNIPARMTVISGPIGSHTVCEVYLKGKWLISDPHINVYYGVTFEDIKKGLIELKDSPREQLTVDIYKSYFTNEPERWAPLTQKQDLIRKIVFSPVYFYYRLLGKRFSFFYQNLYLIGADKKKADRNRFLLGAAN